MSDSIFDHIKAIAAYNARHNHTEKLFKLQLMSWWSRTYSRPLKDPLLQTYTLEELLYEYHDHYERDAASQNAREAETDRIDVEREKASEDWADKMEREEEERFKRMETAKAEKAAKKKKEQPPADPREDPNNIEWMEKLVEKEKEKHGEDFGEDVEIKF